MRSDPLSDVLALLNARSLVTNSLRAGGNWALQFPAPFGIKFIAVAEGKCWLTTPGQAEPLRLEVGDVILVTGAFPFLLASDLNLQPADAVAAFDNAVNGMASVGSDPDLFMLGGHVVLDGPQSDLLLGVLPPLIHVRAASTAASALRWLLDQIIIELDGKKPGSHLASAQLAQLMIVQILRVYLDMSDPLTTNWLRALNDAKVASALHLMHAEPARTWQLSELAQAVGMSRTAFATRFKTIVGIAPLSYLTQWRMRLAEHALRTGNVSAGAVGLSLGYTSESAFNHAFRRVVGLPPKRYRAENPAFGKQAAE